MSSGGGGGDGSLGGVGGSTIIGSVVLNGSSSSICLDGPGVRISVTVADHFYNVLVQMNRVTV